MTTVAAAPGPRITERVQAVDILRGIVMAIMALDHTRDYVHAAAMAFPPEDLTQTTTAIFFTRWITHVCAPVFMFTAGISAYLRLERADTRAELSRFLVTRGLWLIVLEFTVVRAAFFFDFEFSPLFLLVFWALGMSMIALAALVHLPLRVLAVVSVAMIASHNLADGVTAAQFGALGWLWQVLHVPGLLTTGPPLVIVAYPLVPWIGVMAAGFCFGRLYRLPPDRRRTVLMRTGVALIVAFVLLRWLNFYGDPRPWIAQSRPVFTLMSFLNASKYPPSLLFLLMTLGPAILFLGLIDRVRLGDRHPFVVFGRVPLFYFVLHFFLIHLLAAIACAWIYGTPRYMMQSPDLGNYPFTVPPGWGFPLPVVYGVWVAVVAMLYPVCAWYGALKRRSASRWLSYL